MYGQAKNGRKTCKLVIKDTGEPSVMILQFVRNNLENIKRGGLFISITKVEEESLDKGMVRRLHSKGIYRFPALVAEGGKPKIGVNKIKDYIIKEVERSMRMSSAHGSSTMLHPDPYLNDFYSQEMSPQALQREKEEMKGGVQGVGEGLGEDLVRRASEMMRRKKISMDTGADFDTMDARGGNQRENQQFEEEDNIAPNYPPRRQQPEVKQNMYADDMAEAKFMEQAGNYYDY